VVKALERAGFTVTRVSGSNILAIIGMTADELRKLL